MSASLTAFSVCRPSKPNLAYLIHSTSLNLLIGLCLLLSLGACTAIPTKEFGSYRDAVSKARTAGEDVLTDYAAARAESQALKKKKNPKPEEPSRPALFVPSASDGESAIDHIAVRFQAWEVVAKYNEALTSLAEGKSIGQVGTTVDGLVHSLSQSPLTELSTVASQITPFLGPLKTLLAEAEQEALRKRYFEALKSGLPLIKNDFIGLLKKDAAIMFEVRFGLNDLEYQRIVDKVSDAKRNFDNLSSHYPLSDDIRRRRDEIRTALAKLPKDDSGNPAVNPPSNTSGADAVTPASESQMESLKNEALKQVDLALQKNKELFAYRDVLTAYVGILNQMASSIQSLQVAAETGKAPSLPSDEVLKAVISLRQTYLTYKENKQGAL